MAVELPDALKPVATLVIHIAMGAVALAALLVIELLLAGFIQLLGMLPFAPTWFHYASQVLEEALFGVDLFVVGLFLVAEVIKFGKGLWKEIRHG